MGHSVKLHGGATFDWMFATSDPSKIPDGINVIDEPVWGGTTFMLANFSDNISASNYGSSAASIIGYRIYKKTNTADMSLVADVSPNIKALCDYGAKSGDRATYLIYPMTVDDDGNIVYMAPVISDSIDVEFNTYTLAELVRNDGTSFIVGDYVWHFYVNAEPIDFSHNMQTTVQTTHSRYPHIRRSKQNYISGSVSAYAGAVIECGKYVEDQHVFDKWAAFLDSTNPKLLTDPFGHKYIVEITSTSHKVEDYTPSPTTITFDFVEIANADDYSVYAEAVL